MTVIEMKNNCKCTLSYCEDHERECARCNFWASLSTTDKFKGILGRSPGKEDEKCFKKLVKHQEDCTESHYIVCLCFYTLTHGCIWLCEVDRKDTAILVLWMRIWDWELQWLVSGRSATGSWHEDWASALSHSHPCHSMWPQRHPAVPWWYTTQLPVSGPNWVCVQTISYKHAAEKYLQKTLKTNLRGEGYFPSQQGGESVILSVSLHLFPAPKTPDRGILPKEGESSSFHK